MSAAEQENQFHLITVYFRPRIHMRLIHAVQRDLPDLASLSRPTTREMVNARTAEIALPDGRRSRGINLRDYKQAIRELTGESDHPAGYAAVPQAKPG